MKMHRFAPYLGIIAALAIGVLVAVFSGSETVSRVPTIVIPGATSPVISTTTTPMETLPAPKIVAKKITQPSPTPASAPVVVPPVFIPVSDSTASALRMALVNIVCYVSAGSALHSISASGIFIDPKGIILTNAHVAQYFLLADKNVSCTIRSGSPASDKYDASLIYISPLWLHANADVLTKTNPSGTGEYDFALLAVTKSSTPDPLPSSFPYVPLATAPSIAGTPIVIASYGAQFIASSQIASNLSPTVVFGSVKDVFTFAKNTIDVLSLGGSVAAQEGSSGGGVVDGSGSLIGTITTSTITGATDTRSLDAITASYIRAEYATEMGNALDLLLAEPPASAVADFASQIPALESIITANL